MSKLSPKYVAGFIDGEGCIRIDKYKPAKRSTHYKLQVIVVNTNLEILLLLKEDFSGYIHKHTHKGHVAYYWSLYGEAATTFIKKVKPYLVIKRTQAELALEFQAKKTVGKPAPNRKLSKEELELRDAFYQRMKELNARKPVTTTKGHLSEMMV